MALLIALVFLSVFSLANLVQRMDSLPAEVSLRMECAKLIVAGKIPYVDFFVLDAPVILFIQSIPAAILQSDSGGYALVFATFLFEWLISVGSLSLTAALLLRRRWLRDSLWSHGVLLTVAYLNIACVFQFGQTEHFLMLGIIPYIVARWLEYSGKKLREWELIASGMAGAIAILLDPFFVVLPIAIEIAFITQFQRFPIRFKSVFTVLITVTALIVAALYGFAGLMMEGYHSNILPLLIGDRQTFDNRLYGFRSAPDTRIFPYLLVLATILAMGIRKQSTIIVPLVVSGWLGFAYVIAEGKGYTHQCLPMFWCASISFAIIGASLLTDLKRHCPRPLLRFAHLPALTAIILTAIICSALLIQQSNQILADTAEKRLKIFAREDVYENIKRLTRRLDKVLILNNNIAPMYPAMTLLERIPGSRLMWEFPFPILVRMEREDQNRPSKERDRLRDFYINVLTEDIEKNSPTLILVDEGDSAGRIKQNGLKALIETHYGAGGETQFFSDNVTPREFTNQNYPLWTYTYER
ncbi:MAG: hypothetical protein SGJ27_03680 [Candidatus Melainabacteria bacterium]|nr:hypothetical protein [Candidatus Melainabacteria bacterium]